MSVISCRGIGTCFFFTSCIPNAIKIAWIFNTSCLNISNWTSSISNTTTTRFSDTSCNKSCTCWISCHGSWSICTCLIDTGSSCPITITTWTIFDTWCLNCCSSTCSSSYTTSICFCCACSISSKCLTSIISCQTGWCIITNSIFACSSIPIARSCF